MKMKKISSKLDPNRTSSLNHRGSSKSTSSQPSSSTTGPEIVVFDEASKKKQIKPSTVHEWKSFMSSKISKLKDKPASKLQKNDEEVEEEELNRKNDKELQELLETSKLLELYTADRLTGKERRKYNDKKIVELGAKSPKSIKIPTPISLGIQSKRQEREEKELKEAKNLGLYHQSIKHKWKASSSSKLKNRTNRDRGIKMGIGKIKGGMLTLSSSDIKKVQGRNKIKKRKYGSKK